MGKLRATKLKNDEATTYSKIYDYVYGRFATDMKYEITNAYKTELMGTIVKSISDDEFRALKNLITFDFNITPVSKSTKLSPKEIYRLYDQAMRHLYAPGLIGFAVNNFYGEASEEDLITKEDFGGKKYIVTALNNNGIYSRKQLYKHLSYGWYFLWTIPGCGEAARQRILMTLDAWNNTNVEDRLPFYRNIGKRVKK